MYDEEKVYKLKKVENFFSILAEAVRDYGTEGLNEDYADMVDNKYWFIVVSHIKALNEFEKRVLSALARAKEGQPLDFGFTGADTTLLISARYWVAEIGRMCYRCPKSAITRHMAEKGVIETSLSKNGNDFVERSWRVYQDYCTEWLQILYTFVMQGAKSK